MAAAPQEQEMAPPPPPQIAALTDDLLEEIFLRIASPADLARVSIACASFRRLIAGTIFLRRYRSLHPPLLVGFLDPGQRGGFQPAEAPHPNAPLARAAGFSFDYVPRGAGGRRWYPRDVRDGRVLLYRNPDAQEGTIFPDLAVCDPVSRRYLLLPPIPDESLASVQVQKKRVLFVEAFLVPSEAEPGEEEEASFRVFGRVCGVTKMVALVFSTGSGHWDVGASTTCDDAGLRAQPDSEGLILQWPSYAYGCVYWKVCSMSNLLKLDINRMELSIIHLPPDHAERDVIIVETEEGRIGMFSNLSHVSHDTSIYYAIRKDEGQSSNEWQTVNIIPSPVNYNFGLFGASGRYIFLLGIPNVQDALDPACFSLDIKTLKIERVSQMGQHYYRVYPYFSFPPFMLPRTI